MTPATILVAGIGNIFFGDDGFGVAVARRLLEQARPAHVRVVDFGIRGHDLAFSLFEPYELVVLIDTVQRGSKPGTLHVIELDESALPNRDQPDAHGMVPSRAVELARTMGAKIPRLVLVGCEPAHFGDPEHGEIGLSPPVSAAVAEAMAAVESLIARHTGPACTNSA
ncbi:MAG TPA: hydrogenase maturation protease [Candidatus Synoicihabitans sp.]|nr:hydrogenase maturation protease [Candidatus Synoicihabitans sp.]